MGLIKQLEITLAMITIMALARPGWWCHGCLEHERNALMELKAFFNSTTELLNWGFDSNSNCCEWKRVACNDTTGRVVEISLDYVRETNPMEDWYLNASLFLPFENLQNLYLYGNNIAGCLENHGFDKLSTLTRLVELGLGHNKFNNNIISSLSILPNLNFLRLYNNRLQGTLKIQGEFKNLRTLDVGFNEIESLECYNGSNILSWLDLSSNLIRPDFSLSNLQCFWSLQALTWSGNSVNGVFNLEGLPSLIALDLSNVTENGLKIVGASPSLQRISMTRNKLTAPIFGEYSRNFTGLVELDLSSCFLNDLAIKSLEYLPSLKTLQISNLNDALFAQGFNCLKNLESLFVSNSVLGGNLLTNPGLCNLNQLRQIYLMDVDFKGVLLNCFANLTNLESLTLYSQRRIQIPISLNPLCNNSKLIHLAILNGEVYEDTQMQSLIPKFQLESLSLSGQGSLSSFPEFLYHQNNLVSIYIEDIQIKGEFPYWLLSNNTNLVSIELVNLSLRGSLYSLSEPLNFLSTLNISYNDLHGHVPSDFFTYFPNLSLLDMSWNYFNGGILALFSNMSFLEAVDLSNNEFSEQVPSGFCHSSMLQLYLNNNRFQGLSSGSFFNCFNLQLLDLSYNSLTGYIPKSIGAISSLSFLLLHNNYLTGEIPMELCKLEFLSFVDLSHNNLSGHIHILSCLRLTPYEKYSLAGLLFGWAFKDLVITINRIPRTYKQDIAILFSGIDLSCNNLTGKIPTEFGNLNPVLSLNFSHNSLIGQIPSTLSELRQIISLDLSYNKLQGRIPAELTKLSFLSSFSVAYNNLSGKTPEMIGQFLTFEASSYEGNSFLCGLPLRKSCTVKVPPPDDSKDNGYANGSIDMIAFYASFCASYAVFLLGLFAAIFVNPNWRRRWFYFIAMVMNNIYYFLADNLLFLFGFRVYQPLV